MSHAGEWRARGPDDRRVGISTTASGFDEYASARERYFERLRVDSEVRRLERAWQRPPAGTSRAGEPPA